MLRRVKLFCAMAVILTASFGLAKDSIDRPLSDDELRAGISSVMKTYTSELKWWTVTQSSIYLESPFLMGKLGGRETVNIVYGSAGMDIQVEGEPLTSWVYVIQEGRTGKSYSGNPEVQIVRKYTDGITAGTKMLHSIDAVVIAADFSDPTQACKYRTRALYFIDLKH
ncbi:MAG: hypothetical protein HYX41_01090 [Bdellovibrio sp.]|nr:hypothetical protein [Bdellovibrio sp.]